MAGTTKVTDVTTTTPEEKAKADRYAALQESYAVATAALRERHLEEFNDIRKAEAKKRGVDWTPKPTEEEKARAEYAALLEKFPQLAEKTE